MELQLIVRVIDDKGNVLPGGGTDLITTKLRDDLTQIPSSAWIKLQMLLGETISASCRRVPVLSSLYPSIPYLEKQISETGVEEDVLTWGGYSLDQFSPQSLNIENLEQENA
ncbi:hypothetical protein [Hoylesella saccharolytica]|uniref:hypothetical protein n=1 Tax=Hoylesella saccharolytica TaxID=633701 RepID=UPI0028E3DABE|nr:hypothetical protein [Hoylesella saccharolytica]